ncbi:hypothetical protein VPG01_013 [Vibrio phage VPG01]|nr:hypothetical protein VPG01_013 [Vibrio phage VPG01]
MKDRLNYHLIVRRSWVYVSDTPDLKDPEGMTLAMVHLEDMPELLATLKARKGRGKFKYEYHNNIVLVYTGLKAAATQPYLYPSRDARVHYCAIQANEFYLPSIIKELENL